MDLPGHHSSGQRNRRRPASLPIHCPDLKGAVREYLDYYIDNQIPVIILVFDKENDEICDELGGCGPANGRNTLYQAYAFITVEIIGYKFEGRDQGSPSPKWMVFRFLNARNECGEVK